MPLLLFPNLLKKKKNTILYYATRIRYFAEAGKPGVKGTTRRFIQGGQVAEGISIKLKEPPINHCKARQELKKASVKVLFKLRKEKECEHQTHN